LYPIINSRLWSNLAPLLPYIEQGALAQVANIPLGRLGDGGAIGTPIATFNCPSDPSPRVRNDLGEMAAALPAGPPTSAAVTGHLGVSGSSWGQSGGIQ